MHKIVITLCFLVSMLFLLQPSIKSYNLNQTRLKELKIKADQEVTVNEAKQIIQKLYDILPEHARHLKFAIANTPEINAYADAGGNVVIFKGMIDLVKSNDELAIVVGHEIAHHLLSHVYLSISQDHPLVNRIHFEAMADMLGARLAQTAGYNPCAGVTLWKRMRQAQGNDVLPRFSHPNLGARIYQFEQMCR